MNLLRTFAENIGTLTAYEKDSNVCYLILGMELQWIGESYQCMKYTIEKVSSFVECLFFICEELNFKLSKCRLPCVRFSLYLLSLSSDFFGRLH